MGAWLSDKAPQGSIKSVLADQDVRVLTQRQIIRTDHLDYQGSTQTITLHADPDRVIEVTEADGSNPQTFQKGTWDLRSDKIDVDLPGRGVQSMNRPQ